MCYPSRYCYTTPLGVRVRTNLELIEFAVIRLIHFNYPHGISHARCLLQSHSVRQIAMHRTLIGRNRVHESMPNLNFA